jgi:hypothetical protein
MRIYVDATLAGSKNGTVDIANRAKVFRIGGGGLNTETFNGAIDDVKLYKRELTSEEVTKLYNNQM